VAATALERTTPGASVVRWILVDAFVCGGAGALLLAGSPFVDGTLGVSTAFLAALGAFLLAYAAGLVGLVRVGIPAAGVAAVIIGNTVWVVASVIVVIADWLTLTGLGTALALSQAAAVAALAELQLVSLRRSQ
jgi:hypothetical protein